MLPVTADACHERAANLRAIRGRRRPGDDPELYAALTDAAAVFAAAAGVDLRAETEEKTP